MFARISREPEGPTMDRLEDEWFKPLGTRVVGPASSRASMRNRGVLGGLWLHLDEVEGLLSASWEMLVVYARENPELSSPDIRDADMLASENLPRVPPDATDDKMSRCPAVTSSNQLTSLIRELITCLGTHLLQ